MRYKISFEVESSKSQSGVMLDVVRNMQDTEAPEPYKVDCIDVKVKED